MIKTIKKPFVNNEQLFFIHVPKCAGTSFISLLDEIFVNSEICPTHYDLRKFSNNEISDENLQGYGFIRGHIPYDLIIPRLKARPRLITFLRDPVTQFISYYQMRRRVPDPISGVQESIKDLSLDQFLDRSHYVDVISNNATKLFAGLPEEGKLFDFSTTIDIPLAKKRLAECDFIGLTEEYQQSIELFCHVFDFPIPDEQRQLNISPDRGERRDIAQSTINRIRKIQFADMELYAHGKRLFERAIKHMSLEKRRRFSSNYLEASPPLQRNIKLDFRRVLPGMGWHVGEEHPVHKIVRWSGPPIVSKLFFPIRYGSDVRLKFCVVGWLSFEILDSLELFGNGDKILLIREKDAESGGFIFKGEIPNQILMNHVGVLELSFRIKETLRPIDFDPSVGDNRKLGLCYKWLSLEFIDK